jgi:uncharacterized membrane protein YeaQ/YmgE (transglycosylase-associated protein family)
VLQCITNFGSGVLVTLVVGYVLAGWLARKLIKDLRGSAFGISQ